MGTLLIEGGYRLNGTIKLTGGKNSALGIIAGAALGYGKTILENVPNYTDTHILCDILKELGAEIEWPAPGVLAIDGTNIGNDTPSYELVRKLRASFYTAGLLLSRLGRASVPFPGGDMIGARGIDFHLNGFRALGADVSIEHGYVKLRAGRLRGADFYVGKASHGTTVNMMLAAVCAEGTTILENAARDPEIVDLSVLLNSMGAKIRGAGTGTIRIDGVERLGATRHEIIPDRLEAGTFMIAAAATGGDIVVEDAVAEHLTTVIIKLREAGVEIIEVPEGLRVIGPEHPVAVNIETQPYPGFPTDLQPQFTALMTRCNGIAAITETRFESRFGYADELRRMGANLQVDRDTIIVRGVDKLTGAPLESPRDIRGGAALIIAGLMAEGITEVHGMEHIDRGYDHIEEKLSSLGAKVRRLEK